MASTTAPKTNLFRSSGLERGTAAFFSVEVGTNITGPVGRKVGSRRPATGNPVIWVLSFAYEGNTLWGTDRNGSSAIFKMISIPSSPPCGSAARPLAFVVADDALETQLVVRRWLEELGHSVTCVSCGDDAIRVIKHQAVDIVITEVIMPNGDGLEVLLELKKWQPAAKTIAISGGGRYLPATDCLRVAKGLGANEVVPKPLLRTELLAAVERLSAAASIAVA